MKEAALRAEQFDVDDLALAAPAKAEHARPIPVAEGWTPEKFAQEQIQRLVARVFLRQEVLAAKQVVFSAIDQKTDIESICVRVGECLADEELGDVAVVGGVRRIVPDPDQIEPQKRESRGGKRCRGNLWFLPANAGWHWGSKASMQMYMEDIRREFRYSIIHGPPAIEAGEALSLAQWGDGLILVVSAQHSKRLTAMRVREMLAETDVRLLGTVLTDREFPIPEKIYRLL